VGIRECIGLTKPPAGGRRRKLAYGAGLAALEAAPAVGLVVIFALVVHDWSWPAQLLAAVLASALGGLLRRLAPAEDYLASPPRRRG